MTNVTALLERLKTLSADARWAEMRRIEALPSAEAVECALGLLEGLQAEHGPLVGMGCAEVMARHGQPEHRERLVALRPNLPAFQGLRDWRQEIGYALLAMDTRARGECHCAAIRAGQRPPTEERFETMSETPGEWMTELGVRCRVCGRGFQVTRDDSYHYPTFRWA